MRRDFKLPEEDEKYLSSSGFQWETVTANGNWLVINDFPVVSGYNVEKVKLALKIEGGYPISQIDMVYFYPALQRTDNKPIGALANVSFDSINWQRWSRHRTGQNPWRSGLDNVETHLLLVINWLEREFEK